MTFVTVSSSFSEYEAEYCPQCTGNLYRKILAWEGTPGGNTQFVCLAFMKSQEKNIS